MWSRNKKQMRKGRTMVTIASFKGCDLFVAERTANRDLNWFPLFVIRSHVDLFPFHWVVHFSSVHWQNDSATVVMIFWFGHYSLQVRYFSGKLSEAFAALRSSSKLFEALLGRHNECAPLPTVAAASRAVFLAHLARALSILIIPGIILLVTCACIARMLWLKKSNAANTNPNVSMVTPKWRQRRKKATIQLTVIIIAFIAPYLLYFILHTLKRAFSSAMDF